MQKNNAKQVNSYREIGQTLRDARVSKHESLADLQRATQVQKKYLARIEAGDFKDLPGSFYSRAFVKKYANAVGLNGDEFLAQYSDQFPDPRDPRYINQVSDDRLLASINQEQYQAHRSLIKRYFPVVVITLIVLVVLIGLWLLVASDHHDSQVKIDDNSASLSGARLIHRKPHRKSKPKRQRRPDHTKLKLISKNLLRTNYLVVTNRRSIPLRMMNLRRPASGQINHRQVNLKRITSVKPGDLIVINLNNSPRAKIQVDGQTVKLKSAKLNQSLKLRIRKQK